MVYPNGYVAVNPAALAVRPGATSSCENFQRLGLHARSVSAASDILGVPAAYALYCGPISYRQDLPCGPTHKPTDDDRCHRSGVCVLPALSAMEFLELAEFANDPARMAIDAYEWATPLEDLVDPRRGPHRVHDPRLSIANADLRSFLLQPQPLPMSPQYWPPPIGLQVIGTQAGSPHT